MSVSPARESDRDGVVSTLVSAFVDDPVERWLFPESEQYLAHFPEFVAAFGGEAFSQQTVWALGELSAVALWLPPDAQPDAEAIVTVLSQSVSPTQHADMFSVLEQMDKGHPDVSALVSALARSPPCRARNGTRGAVADAVPQERRRGSSSRLP